MGERLVLLPGDGDEFTGATLVLLLIDEVDFDEADPLLDAVAFALADDDALFLGEGDDDDLAELVDLAEFAAFAEAWDVAECVGAELVQLESGLAFVPVPAELDLALRVLDTEVDGAGVPLAVLDAEMVGVAVPLPDAEMFGVAVPLDDDVAGAVLVLVVVTGEVVLTVVADACADVDEQGFGVP